MTQAVLESIATPDGAFSVLADATGAVLASGWTDDAAALVARLRREERPARIAVGTTGVAEAVSAYYAGEFDPVAQVAVRQGGTGLQLRGWEELRHIPPGGALTYAEFAAAVGSPRAVRAAAGICARNAPALFVPCHRVTRSDGSMGGFAWGVDVKRSLLARERAATGTGLF